jgi:hypothetical protein
MKLNKKSFLYLLRRNIASVLIFSFCVPFVQAGENDDLSIHVYSAPFDLRPCCAFGMDLKADLGNMHVPGFKLTNIRSQPDLGPHTYNSGIIPGENNGVAYTCKGGFIDTAHVRDNADITLFLTKKIEEIKNQPTTIELPDQGGKRRIVLRPIPDEFIKKYGRRNVALAEARWLAYQLSIWHEISTWFGFSSFKVFPEKVSAFSPEDLYSNIVGINLAVDILRNHLNLKETQYDKLMDASIKSVFTFLDAKTLPQARAAMKALDGKWWDSTKRLPDYHVVMKRNFEIGPTLKPWRLSPALAPNLESEIGCDKSTDPILVTIPSHYNGLNISDFARLEIYTDDVLAENDFPNTDRNQAVTPDDFPAIIELIRLQNQSVFNSYADKPGETAGDIDTSIGALWDVPL